MSISETIPTYRQLDPNGFFCADGYLLSEGEAFEFDGTPNEHMEPLNEPARKKLSTYLKMLETAEREYAQKNGRTYSGRSRSLDVMVAEATADARRIELRPGDGGIPLMSAKLKGEGITRKVDLEMGERVVRRRPGRPPANLSGAPL